MRVRLLMIAAAGALFASCSMVSASSSPETAPPLVTVAPAVTSGAPAATVPVTDPATTQPAVASFAAPVTVGESSAQGCKDTGRTAVIDRATQRAWLCLDGTVTAVFPITSANDQPDPGHYKVYAKDLKAYSTAGGHYSTMTHFVAFTRGKYTGARVAFHSLPKYRNGDWVEQPSAVGDLNSRGDSAGCIRVLPDDAVLIWDTLKIGDAVVVIS